MICKYRGRLDVKVSYEARNMICQIHYITSWASKYAFFTYIATSDYLLYNYLIILTYGWWSVRELKMMRKIFANIKKKVPELIYSPNVISILDQYHYEFRPYHASHRLERLWHQPRHWTEKDDLRLLCSWS